MDSLPEELDLVVRAELKDGEQIVWTGQPRPDWAMRAGIPIVLFGIPWTAFALFWMAGASFGAGHDGLGMIFPLFGLPFVAIGIGMLSSPYWLYRRAKRTCYALTDQRAIIWQAGFSGTEVRSFDAGALGKMMRRDFSDGIGDLIFEEIVTVSTDTDGDRTTNRAVRGFLSIENVKEVEDLVRVTLLAE